MYPFAACPAYAISQTKPPEESRVRGVTQEYAPISTYGQVSKHPEYWFRRMDGFASLPETWLYQRSWRRLSVERRRYLQNDGITLYEIKNNIGHFLVDKAETYDFIHMSHVIEHIPKYSLLWIGDSLYLSLKINGTLFLRIPNMEGPTPNSSYYVMLAHEYGFAGGNLESLLDICGFDHITFHTPLRVSTVKGRIGDILRSIFILESRMEHRLFGVNTGGQFGAELIATAVRGTFPPFFDPKFF